MTFQVDALSYEPFARYFEMTEDELARHLAVRQVVTNKPGFPCRVTLDDAEPGEEVVLLNYLHQDAASPYRASHAIYVRKGAPQARRGPREIPPFFCGRVLSVRAFNAAGMIVGARLVIENREVPKALENLFESTAADYVHIHFAKFGCFAACAKPA